MDITFGATSLELAPTMVKQLVLISSVKCILAADIKMFLLKQDYFTE